MYTKSTMGPVARWKATLAFKPVDHLIRREFGFWPGIWKQWKLEGLPDDYRDQNLFGFDPEAVISLAPHLGSGDTPFFPPFEEKVIKEEPECQIMIDNQGSTIKVFKDDRYRSMPQFLAHCVRSPEDWYGGVEKLLNPDSLGRWEGYGERILSYRKSGGKEPSSRGFSWGGASSEPIPDDEHYLLGQWMCGGYMHLRNLMGAELLPLALYDYPRLIHDIMNNWLHLMQTVWSRCLNDISMDFIMMGEDICYKNGLLISPSHFKEFLAPYYHELIASLRKKQQQRLYFFIDSDGDIRPAIPLYRECGADGFHPFEVTEGQDIVEIGQQYPEIIIWGGLSKTMVAKGPPFIDHMLERILPVMKKRGGYIPHIDHLVSEDISLNNFLYYRNKVAEID